MRADDDLSDPAGVERWQHHNTARLARINRWQERAFVALIAGAVGFAIRSLI